MADEREAIANVMQMVQHLSTKYGWQCDLSSTGEANVTVRLADGTSQKVSIFGRRDLNGQPVMVFYTAVAPESTVKDPKEFLRKNAGLDHCNFALVKNMVVVLDTQLLMTADYPEVAKKVQNVAYQGEVFQRQFRGGAAV